MTPIDQLKSVLCDPTGECCITGSDEDRAIVERALKALAEQPAQQEPVAWWDEERDVLYRHCTHDTDDYHKFKRTVPLYAHPPQRTEQNFCPRCGKRTNDIHTCTPPKE